MTVHSVYQMFGVFLDKKKNLGSQSLMLDCEFNFYQKNKYGYSIPPFVVAAFWTYFVEVRPNFMPDEGMSQVKREFEGYFVMTEKFFVNSKSNQDFRVRQTKSSFLKLMAKLVNEPVQKRQDFLNRQVAALLPSSNNPCQVVASQSHAIQAVTEALGDTAEYSAYHIRDAVVCRLNGQRHTRASARASAYVRVYPRVSYSDDAEASRLHNFGRQYGWPAIKDHVCAFVFTFSAFLH